MTTLSLEHLTVRRGARAVVTEVVAQARAGDVIAVMGPNGAGKSTLLAAAMGLVPVAGGRVRVRVGMRADADASADTDDLDPHASSPRQLARAMGYVPQQVAYAFGPTVLDVALLGRYAHGSGLGLASASDLALAHAALAKCQAEGLAARRFAELSGGERQRVLLAQLLCQDAPIWLLDEPTSGLDPLHAHRLWSLMAAEAAAGRAVVIATHDLSLARQFATQAWLVHDGEVRCGAVDDMLASAATGAAFGVCFALTTVAGVKHVVPVVPAATAPTAPTTTPAEEPA